MSSVDICKFTVFHIMGEKRKYGERKIPTQLIHIMHQNGMVIENFVNFTNMDTSEIRIIFIHNHHFVLAG